MALSPDDGISPIYPVALQELRYQRSAIMSSCHFHAGDDGHPSHLHGFQIVMAAIRCRNGCPLLRATAAAESGCFPPKRPARSPMAAGHSVRQRQNSSIDKVSARLGRRCRPRRTMPVPPIAFKLWRSILRRWPNAAASPLTSSARRQASGSRRGSSCTTDEVTFGGGVERLRRHVELDHWRLARQPREHAEPTIGAVARRAQIRSATSRWNISVSARIIWRPGLGLSQPTSSGVAML